MFKMKRVKLAIGILAIFGMSLAIFFVLRSDGSLITHPKGIIARSELDLINTVTLLMLVIVVPTFIFLFMVAWRYREKNANAKYEPEKVHGVFKEWVLWLIPTVIIAVMAVITWKATHKLDPYKPLEGKPLRIQVVALDWKWLFIYPEQGIASVNFVQFPAKTPIHLTLAADGSPMNSFWLPQLSGQIYAMTGMTTQLHIMADEPGVYTGRAAEINGEGFADMTFVAKSTESYDFDAWVAKVKESPLRLTHSVYAEFTKPSRSNPITLYSYVEKNLFDEIVMKYMHPPETSCKTSSLEN
jgi:cytochrome o ubiquinol oxidase subunit 2